jgi:hypothetical protein
MPSVLPIGEPSIPRRITDTARDGVDKSRNHRGECRLYAPTKFLITPSLLNLSHFLVSLAIGSDFTLFDGLDLVAENWQAVASDAAPHDSRRSTTLSWQLSTTSGAVLSSQLFRPRNRQRPSRGPQISSGATASSGVG